MMKTKCPECGRFTSVSQVGEWGTCERCRTRAEIDSLIESKLSRMRVLGQLRLGEITEAQWKENTDLMQEVIELIKEHNDAQ